MKKTRFEQNVLDATGRFANNNGIPFGVHHENMLLNAIRSAKNRYIFIGLLLGCSLTVLLSAIICVFL